MTVAGISAVCGAVYTSADDRGAWPVALGGAADGLFGDDGVVARAAKLEGIVTKTHVLNVLHRLVDGKVAQAHGHDVRITPRFMSNPS